MWRGRFAVPLITVTGSNGKTTVKQMLATVLHHVHGNHHLATKGNLNNDIGLPLTLLRWRANHERAVIEMGMNHPGEIAYLADIAQPTVALVNNAQREHLEFMGSVEAVARENGSVFTFTAPTGTAVFPADEPYTDLWRGLAGGRKVMTFAMNGGADVFAKAAHWKGGAWQVHASTPEGDCHFTVNVAGRHNVKNALAALACAMASGISAQQAALGLSKFEAVKGRSRSMQIDLNGRPITVIDDTYNANPDSMKAAVDVLADLPQPSLLVVGDMGEVGDNGPAFHRELGQ
jgi:UDP-N-acetylmuramoyl-tripeptide--D-alanyl-D-alanine ligase